MDGGIGANEWIPVEGQRWIAEPEQKDGAALTVEAEVWNPGGILATFSYLREPEGKVASQCRMHGMYSSRRLPIYVREAAMAHALEPCKA